MARRVLNERHIRNIQKIAGKSYAVTIPIDIIRTLKWRERQKVVVTQQGRVVIIRDWPAHSRGAKPTQGRKR